MRKNVLIVLEARILAGYMKVALEEEGIAAEVLSIGTFLERLKGDMRNVGVVILEMIIPHEDELLVEETDDGNETGSALYRKLQKKAPGMRTILLKNRDIPTGLKPAEHLLEVLKFDATPSFIVDCVQHTFTKQSSAP